MKVADLADDMPAALAHGPRKRVAMARALVSEPRLLLLDEPASGLNESELPGLGELICELSTQTSVVVIEHRMDLMMSICEEIFVLDFGKVISSGTPAKVQADPAVTAAYLGVDDAGPRDAQDPADARDPCWMACRLVPRPAPSPRCSARTARARRPCCAPSPG
jgi:branched-chain amino acid transport system ATP-binding protein